MRIPSGPKRIGDHNRAEAMSEDLECKSVRQWMRMQRQCGSLGKGICVQ